MAATSLKFRSIDWATCNKEAFQLQQKITAAYLAKDLKRVNERQDQLTHSFAARALAVRKVVSNDGKKTPGVDNVIWETDQDKINAIRKLKNLSGYKASPVRRVHIPKANGKMRPLGIPTMFDRAVQALDYQALVPVAECTADPRSYGYRPYKSIHDACQYLKLVLGAYNAKRRWVREGDISQFFDKISHEWILNHIPINKRILTQFIRAGFRERGVSETQETVAGTPQGGVISPLIANMVLDGREPTLREKNFLTVRYADDFVVLGQTKEELVDIAKPRVIDFLKERGLELNEEKSLITNIEKGFDFLGFTFREYHDPSRVKGTKKGIFLVTPSRKKVKAYRAKRKERILSHKQKPMYLRTTKLNQSRRGWAENYRCVTAKKVFSSVGQYLWKTLWSMITRKHRGVPRRNRKTRYFTQVGGNKWVFRCKDSKGGEMTLFQIGWVAIKRHMRCEDKNPFRSENANYFKQRRSKGAKHSILLNKNASNLLNKQSGICPVCLQSMLYDHNLEVHHILSRKLGGKDPISNLVLLHKVCHAQVTHSTDAKLRIHWQKIGVRKLPDTQFKVRGIGS